MNDLQFIRNVTVFESYELALEGLAYMEHLVGQPICATYRESNGSTINGILAIGIQNGTGQEAFSILASGRRLDEIVAQYEELLKKFNAHIVLPGDSQLGHIQTGGDLNISAGKGTVKNDAITLAKLAKMASPGILGNLESGKNPKILSSKEVLQFIGNPEVNQNAWSHIKVGGNIISSTSKTDTFELVNDEIIKLVGDVTLKKITISHNKGAGFEHIPSGGKAEQYLKWVSNGKAVWSDLPALPTHYAIKSVPEADVIMSGWTDAVVNKIKHSVNLEGNPTTTTQLADDDSTRIATTAMVQAAIKKRLEAANAMTYKGVIDASVTSSLPKAEAGDMYKVSVGGTISGMIVHVNDTFICKKDDTPANTPENWDLICVNDGAVMGPETAVEDNIAVFGTSGSLIKDSGISKSLLVLTTRKIIAGEGLLGGGTLGKDITLTHQTAPTSRFMDAQIDGDDGQFITSIQLDKFGHIYKVRKGSPTVNTGSVGGTGYVVTKVQITGSTLSGTSKLENELNVYSAKQLTTDKAIRLTGMITSGVTTKFDKDVEIPIEDIDDGWW